MELDTLKDLYIEEIKDLYSAEKQLVKALPKMAKAANTPELQKAFRTHLKQTAQHAARLEQICQELDVSPRGKKCVGMEGLIEEGSELIKEGPDPDVLDAGLIAAAQHVEHYEIAGYGTVRTYARQLGLDNHASLLQQTLDEEGATDQLLTELAESGINVEAEV
jgi:ferritin-like metal-binding protein YciE